MHFEKLTIIVATLLLTGCESTASLSHPYSGKLPYCKGVWVTQGRGTWYCLDRETFERWQQRNELSAHE
jgi:hypothetical protein